MISCSMAHYGTVFAVTVAVHTIASRDGICPLAFAGQSKHELHLMSVKIVKSAACASAVASLRGNSHGAVSLLCQLQMCGTSCTEDLET